MKLQTPSHLKLSLKNVFEPRKLISMLLKILNQEAPFTEVSPGIGGPGGTKLIFGTRLHGTTFRAREEDKLETYTKEVEEMENLSKEEYLTTLRRRSSGFSRGVSKYRGVARHHHNGRWEARIGRVSGNKYLYLGTYDTQEEAAMAYDMAAIEHRGPNAVTNFDINNYMDKNMPKIEVKEEEEEEEEDVEMKQELITPNSLNKVVQPDENETHNHHQGDNQIETSVSKLEKPINTSDSQAMDPIEEHKHYPWDLCLDNSFSSIPIPDISLEEASEFLRLFDDNGFEELDIEFTFDEPFGGVSTSHSSSSLSTMTSDDCSSIN
ncbi:hypothetical protein ACJIZ3_015988 [Penstemon smallii]|uniref:AP2/ERF domain-containing protein n=1 Tax=Penstemon smallii TaxID=265156 RepID=A0ABD3RP66_9LAMI